MLKQKGVCITGKGKIEVRDDCVLPEQICSTGALVKPVIWGLCTTDAHLCESGLTATPYLLNKATGHETCGIIEEIGADVTDFAVGDRVCVCATMPMWRSLQAQDGNARQSSDNMYFGIDYPDRGGTFVEHYYIRDADMNLGHIPDNVTWEQAIMIPDMVQTAFAGIEDMNLRLGESVCVYGIGPVGLMGVRGAVLKGASRVIGIGSRQNCADLAREFGATDIVDYHDPDLLERVVKINGGPVDAVLLAADGVDSLSNALSIVKRGGRVMSVQAYMRGEEEIPLSMAAWCGGYGDKTIKGIQCNGGRLNMERYMQLISCGRMDPGRLLTHVSHGMETVPEAMQLYMDRDRSLIKAAVFND